jgi:alkanesulfonate monooxygenase SsuD/methylene tetrahydromethanopterin reductase-like flavin-dependent oxidoreductase (luciferase family)
MAAEGTLQLGITPWDLGDRRAAGLAQQAALAEQLGYESFWLPESHFAANAVPEPLMLLAAVVASTSRIRLGTTSLLLPVRNPVQVAEQVAVLDQLSDGRVILGVGRGFASPMLRVFDVDPREKRALFERCLQTMLRAWSGAPLPPDTPGMPSLRLDPLPVQQPHPPVWVAAFGPKALAQAGRLGLPYLASPLETLVSLQENYAIYVAARTAQGLGPARVVPVMRTLFVTESAEETRLLRARVHAEAHNNGRLPADATLEDWAVIGDAGFVRERVAAYRERLGITHLIVTRLRISGIERARLERSAARVLEALG